MIKTLGFCSNLPCRDVQYLRLLHLTMSSGAYHDTQAAEGRHRTPSGSVPRPPPRALRQTSQPAPRPQDRVRPRRESQERSARASTEETTLPRRSRNSTSRTVRYPAVTPPPPYEPDTFLSGDRNVPPPRPAASEQAQPDPEPAEPPSISG